MTAAKNGDQTTVSYLVNECGEGISTAACFIHDWQTLIAGLLALVAAFLTVLMIIDAVLVHPEASDAFFKSVAGLCSDNGLSEPSVSGISGTPVF